MRYFGIIFKFINWSIIQSFNGFNDFYLKGCSGIIFFIPLFIGKKDGKKKIFFFLQPKIFEVKTKSTVYLSKAVIIASRTEENRLKVSGEAEFNFGASYCAIQNAIYAIIDGYLSRTRKIINFKVIFGFLIPKFK